MRNACANCPAYAVPHYYNSQVSSMSAKDDNFSKALSTTIQSGILAEFNGEFELHMPLSGQWTSFTKRSSHRLECSTVGSVC